MDAERRNADLILPVVVAVVIGMTIFAGWTLLTDYRPVVGDDGVFDAERPRSVAWFRMLARALAGTGIALAIRMRHRPWALAATDVGTVAAGATTLLSPLVMWDQLALNAVTVGSNIRGLWWPLAHGEELRFLIIDGAEIGVATYQRWLVVNIVAVVVACAALLASAWPTPTEPSLESPSEN